MTADAPRTTQQRREDTLARFENDVDVWVATADAEGVPCLVPLSFRWDGETFLMSTGRTLPTGRNLAATGRVRLAFGVTRDVVLVEGTATRLEATDLPPPRSRPSRPTPASTRAASRPPTRTSA